MTKMTILDTSKLSSEDILHLTDEQKAKLPTILDIVEYVSTLENAEMREYLNMNGDFLGFSRLGKYMYMSDQAFTNVAKLFPISQTPFTLMRGQNAYFAPSYPSLYRPQKINSEDFCLISRLRACEFILTFQHHPVVNEIRMNCMVEDMAIAQHYEFPTEYMDITNNKWVAAFFATTYKSGELYLPTETGFGNGIGVFYISNPAMRFHPHFLDNVYTLGFQYFERPTRQYSLVYKMNENEDMDANPMFSRFVFRHDTEASKVVYNMSYKQQRFYPNDAWHEIAQKIKCDDYPLSLGAVELSRQYGVTLDFDEICQVLDRHCVKLTDKQIPVAHLTSEQIAADVRKWNEYGRAFIQNSILPILPVFNL